MICTALAAIAAILLIYGVFIEPNWIEIKRATIINDRLASTIGHLKVIHLSDLHINTIGYREKKAVKILNSLCPDIIFVTGDLKAFKAGFGPVSDFLNQVSAKLGIWAVFGNSDYRKENGEETLGEELNSGEIKKLNGINILRNSHDTISIPKTNNSTYGTIDKFPDNIGVTVIGLDDPVTNRDDLSIATNGMPVNTATILLTHFQKFTINSVAKEQFKSIDLMLSGHTHGGQIFFLKYLPSFILQWYFKRKSDKKNRDATNKKHSRIPSVFEGTYMQGKTIGHINRGLGSSFYPIRLGVRPEITILEFRARTVKKS